MVCDRITIVCGDITSEKVDAIVNAANTDLLLGGGVAGAIRLKGGPSIQAECSKNGPIQLGDAAITGAGDLFARHVIHAAVMHLGDKPTAESIEISTLNSLWIAADNNLEVIAFPALGTGIGGFAMSRSAEIMLREVIEFQTTHECPFEVRFILFDEKSMGTFKESLDLLSN
ncbi:MAG: hypothetical protein HN590_02655 [Calditrichaeota bacterium]|jgi:O-acetyl-ADP-ribose deacetylase|nr:hypothetical protein [Calditrichota bacterium]MBT7788914.1 hypothetical protein [Calditrichota bacterium]